MISVVILVGGKGSRVSHITDGKSKAEIKILKNKSIIELQLDSLIKLKKSIYILSNYKFISLKSEINKYQNNKIKIIDEELRRGTAGCLKVLENKKSRAFLIISGDLVFNMDFNKLLKFHLLSNFHFKYPLFSAKILCHRVLYYMAYKPIFHLALKFF
jgi:NDP-sugar pyrophosphorylase family protein